MPVPERSLSGVRVLEAGSSLAVGFCGMLLAQLGASVTVFRPPTAKPPSAAAELRARAESAYFGRGKEQGSGTAGGPDFMTALETADVVLRGDDPVQPADAARLRNESVSWGQTHPRLIYVAITPFGIRGDLSVWAGGDLNAQALSGWVSIIGNPTESPLGMNYGIGAMQAGLSASGATAAALINRGPDGRGELVDISEAQVITASIRQYGVVYRWSRIPLRRNGRRAPGSSGRYPHTVWPCKDGDVMIICRSEREWERFIEMIGSPSWAAEERYRNFYEMGTVYPDEVDELIVPWMLARTKSEIGALATQFGVPLAPIRTAAEALQDEQLEHREFFETVEFEGSQFRLPGLAAKFLRPADAGLTE